MTKLFSTNFRGLLAAASVAGLLALTGTADAAKSVDLTADQSAAVKEVADYIQGFRTLQGEFTQVRFYNITVDGFEVDATSARFNLGFTWYPMRAGR